MAAAEHSPAQELRQIAAGQGLELLSQEFADHLDSVDPLRSFREEFHYPEKSPLAKDKDCIYFCGNSLGLMPKRTRKYLDEELNKWADYGVEGHTMGERPWARIDEFVTPMTAEIVGAESPEEVVVMNSLSVNLHFLLTAFYRPEADGRRKILMEANAFCSDHHVVRSQIAMHGLEQEDCLLMMEPREGEEYIRTEDILAMIEKEGQDIALIMFGTVQYMTGQMFDIPAITAAGHKQGCVVAFDLAHAVGNVPLKLHEWGVDWAAWCSYKYLNSGPGSIGGAFVHSRYAQKTAAELPRLKGWWGQTLENRFKMGSDHIQLPVHTEAGMSRLREKSLLLTGFLQLLLDDLQASLDAETQYGWVQLTPRDPEQRGAQISLRLECPVDEIQNKLSGEGVVLDTRRPNIIRISPAPIYNCFSEVFRFVQLLKECLKK